MIYHRNRLIRPYHRVGMQLEANNKGVAVLGVVQADYLEPTHNKQACTKLLLFHLGSTFRLCPSGCMQTSCPLPLNESLVELCTPHRKSLRCEAAIDWGLQDFNDTAQYRALQMKLSDVLKVYWWDKVNPPVKYQCRPLAICWQDFTSATQRN